MLPHVTPLRNKYVVLWGMGKKSLHLSAVISVPEPPSPSTLAAEDERLAAVLGSPETSKDEVARAWPLAGKLGDFQLAYDGHRRQLRDCADEYSYHFVYYAYHAGVFFSFVQLAAPACEPEMAEQLQLESLELLEAAIELGERVWQTCPVPDDDEPDAPVRLMVESHSYAAILQQQLGFDDVFVQNSLLGAARWSMQHRFAFQ